MQNPFRETVHFLQKFFAIVSGHFYLNYYSDNIIYPGSLNQKIDEQIEHQQQQQQRQQQQLDEPS